LENYLAI